MMNMFEDKPTPEQVEFLKRLNRRRAALKEAFTPEVLDILEKEFQTNLPCFQGKAGSYDPLDAMRRDAYREMILFIEMVVGNNNEPEEETTE